MPASTVTQPWAHKGGAGLLVWIVGYVGVALLWVQLALLGVSFNWRNNDNVIHEITFFDKMFVKSNLKGKRFL